MTGPVTCYLLRTNLFLKYGLQDQYTLFADLMAPRAL